MSISDTDPRQQQRYDELLRQLTVAQRWAMIGAFDRGIRKLLTAQLRTQFPSASDDEIRMRIAVRMYGRTIAARLFPQLPDDAR